MVQNASAQVAAHLALVGDAREPAGARQHRQQRQLGQRHGRVAVVGQHDVVGGQRQLVAAAGRRAADRRTDTSGPSCALASSMRVARLVGELAEVDLVRVGGAGQHADVGAGAEHAVLAGLEHHHLHLRMLEAQPLHGVAELDVDAEVVGVELELIALEQAGGLVDVHDQLGHVAVELELPVAVARRLGLEVDAVCHGAGLLPIATCSCAAMRASMYRGRATEGGAVIMHYYSALIRDNA